MNEQEMMAGSVLTPDEQVLRDFVESRQKKAEAEIERLRAEGSEDLTAWSGNFTLLTKTYGKSSTEPFKLFKYYMRQDMIPKSIARDLLMQLYMDAQVDAGFVNLLARVMREETEAAKAARIEDLKMDLGKKVDENGCVTVYRGCFEKPFGIYDDGSRPFEKAFTFTTDPEAARHYACCWYPAKAQIITASVPVEEIVWYGAYQEDKPVVILPVFKGGSARLTGTEDLAADTYEQNKIDRKTSLAAYAAEFRR